MLIKTKLRQLATFILPFTSINYFIDYFNLINQTICQQNSQRIKQIHLYNIFCFAQALHFLYLGFPLDDFQRVLHFDGAYYTFVSKYTINKLAAIIQFVIIYLNWILYLKADIRLYGKLHRVLVKQKWRHFFDSSTINGQFIPSLVKRYFLFITMLIQSLALVILLMMPYAYIVISLKLFTQYSSIWTQFHCLTRPFLILWHLLMSIGYWLYFYSATHAYTLAFSIVAGLICMFKIKMKKTNEFFIRWFSIRKRKRPLVGRAYFVYRFKLIQSIIFFLQVNRMHGRLFLAVLVAVCPAQCLLTMWSIYGKVKNSQLIPVYFLNIYAFIFVFILHLLLALISFQIHQPAKALISLASRGAEQPDIRLKTKLRLALDIEWIHTKRRYGFRYGNFGLISMSSFAKYIFVYGRILMWSSTLVRRDY